MERWYRNNKTLIPWTLLGLEIAISIGLRLYKLRTGSDPDSRAIPSPRSSEAHQKLSDTEIADLPYPPDAFPGARDVASPYGSLRVYEWGPADGRKVVLVHGISNPCVALGAIAHGLVDRGCRVILFDLPGRGYSETPVPTAHSVRLYTTSIFLALTSSDLSWTGEGNAFALIGYSLGGGIVANFTAHFPRLVSSLVLLAPAGLVREQRFGLMNKFLLHTGLVGEAMLESIMKRRLRAGIPPLKAKGVIEPEAPATEEFPKEEFGTVPDAPVLSRARPGIDFATVLPWQIDNHAGFVKSYISSMRHGPIANQHAFWRLIGERLSAQSVSEEDSYAREGLQNGKVLIIGGTKDVLIAGDELREDAENVLEKENVEFYFVDAGHDLAITKSGAILDCIWDFWQRK